MSTSLPEQTPPLSDPLDRLPLRERKKLRTRRAIQEHALRLFLDQGYDATTVEQVAAAAEVSPSTVFRYFSTKEDLVVTDEYDPVMAQFFRAQPADLTPLEALRATFRQILPYLEAQDRATVAARTRMMLEVPALRARMLDSMRTGTLSVVAELLGERTGRAPGDPRVQAFAWAVMGVLQAAMYTWLDSDATLDLSALVDANLEFLAEGLPL
ncbi:TetR/AcrR family transcriptional regulator [Actinomadura kijaniata]|uniref:TetR/AcrR family transcriptional regulator n=1 Tax=Actinomadura kijaniata TaxID=46161 RepID=UPI003F1A29B9